MIVVGIDQNVHELFVRLVKTAKEQQLIALSMDCYFVLFNLGCEQVMIFLNHNSIANYLEIISVNLAILTVINYQFFIFAPGIKSLQYAVISY